MPSVLKVMIGTVAISGRARKRLSSKALSEASLARQMT